MNGQHVSDLCRFKLVILSEEARLIMCTLCNTCRSLYIYFLITTCAIVQVYVACLRVLCGTEDASSEETCQILQKVYDVCGDQDHLPMSAFLARTNCTTNVPTTTTTTATPTTTKAKPNLWGKYSQ